MEKTKSQRNSAVELLRILAMLFIVCSHCSIHGGLPAADSRILFNTFLRDWFILGNLGADMFMLISGYVLCDHSHYSIRKSSVKMLPQVWFYSWLGLAIYLLTGHPFHMGILLSSLFPTVFYQYWFFTYYFVLMFFFPYLNRLLNGLKRNQLRTLITTMLVFWSVIPTFTNQHMGGGVMCHFVMFYSIGAYFKLYPDTIFQKKGNRYLLTAVSGILMFASSVVLKLVFGDYMQYFYSRQSLLGVGFILGLFTMAIYHESFCSPWINRIAGCTFGVYLFHDHSLLRNLVWQEWLPKAKYYDSWTLIIAIAVSVLIVMTAGTVLEWIRQATVKKPMEKLLDRAIGFTQNRIQKLFNRMHAVFCEGQKISGQSVRLTAEK